MSLIKRISSTLVSRIDKVVSEMENHEAVIEASLGEKSQKIAAAKVSLSRVRQQEAQTRKDIQTQIERAALWEKRAIESAAIDESRALECVRRKRLSFHRVENLEDLLNKYVLQVEQLGADIERGEQRIRETRHRLDMLKARQHTNAALAVTHSTKTGIDDDIEKAFDRWEITLGSQSLQIEEPADFDNIEREFLEKETHEDLQRELRTILNKEEQSS